MIREIGPEQVSLKCVFGEVWLLRRLEFGNEIVRQGIPMSYIKQKKDVKMTVLWDFVLIVYYYVVLC